MPRLTQAVPKYRKHRASGQAIVTIAGRDHYLGKYGTKASRMLYDRLITEYLSCNRAPVVYTEESGITVVEVLAAFWKHAKVYYVKHGHPTTEQGAYRVLIRDIRRLYGDLDIQEFGPKALKAVRQVWIDRGQKRKTVNENARKLIRLFRWAAAEELISASIPERLSTVAGLRQGRSAAPESAPVQPVSVEIVGATMDSLLPVVRDMVRVQLLSGMRPNEVCNLRPGDIDRSSDVWEFRPHTHKTEHHGRERIVFLGPEAQQVLSPYLHNSPFCFSPQANLSDWLADKHAKRVTPLSCGNRPGKFKQSDLSSRLGEQYTTASYRRAIHRACDRAFPPPGELAKRAGETAKAHIARLGAQRIVELKQWQSAHRWSPNQLRHTAATKIRKEFGLEAAQVILGHAAADVTQMYAERDAEKARDVIRQVG